MMAELLDRRALKKQVRACLKTVQVNAMSFTALYLGLFYLLTVLDQLSAGSDGDVNLMGLFASVLTGLVSVILQAGFVMYCMAVRRGERAEFLTLFDGFSMVGKIILLNILMYFFISLWSALFVFPGIWAAYRYRFALFNLYENPDLSVFEALNLSKAQTRGYKYQLFIYDISYMGWTILAGLPATFVIGRAAYQMADTMIVTGISPELLLSTAGTSILFTLVTSLWSMAVQLFYLPQMQCGELAYFEAAKRTSHLGVDNGPSDFDVPPIPFNRPGAGPDNMGGY